MAEVPLPSVQREFARPMPLGTVILLLGCLLSAIFPSGDAAIMANEAAIILGMALAMTIGLECTRHLANGFRADLLMLIALYGLVYAEFLLPQPQLLRGVGPLVMQQCLWIVALGFTGIAVGRHWRIRGTGLQRMTEIVMTPRALLWGMVLCALVGYLHMLWAVNFNPVRLVEAMMGPRFSQPWGRGRFGGWADLLNELGLLIYLIPPAAGVVYARRGAFTRSQKVLAFGLLALTLFHGFSSGTRNLFVVYVLCFLGGYLVTAPRLSWVRVGQLVGLSAVVVVLASQTMMEFRRMGLSTYLDRPAAEKVAFQRRAAPSDFLIDNNLYTLSQVVQFFPSRADFLGWEVPYWALVKPIPRALWSGKPEGLSVSLEQARYEVGASAATWSSTFLGEAYMSAGNIGVFLFAFLFGIAAAWWNTLLRHNGDVYRRLLFASGLFAAMISMRSMFWLTTAVLPTLALLLYGRWFLKRSTPAVTQDSRA